MKLEYLLPLVVLPTLWLSYLGIYRLLAEDRILRTLYRDHREIWESFGRPCGWQWSPPGRMCVPWRKWTFPRTWLRADPEWLQRVPDVRDDFEEIRALLRRTYWPAAPLFAVGVCLFAIAAYFLEHKS